MTLSLEKSPRQWRDNAWDRYLSPGRRDAWAAPATADDLREIQAELRRIASRHHGRIEKFVGHVTTSNLARIDHLIAVHICGYVYRPEGGGAPYACPWQTGAGTFSTDATQKWTTDTDLACNLMVRYTPRLRLDIRFGGERHGQIRKARFDEKHPDPSMAGREMPLPDEWPHHVRSYPAIAIIDTFLTAFALQKESAEKPQIAQAKSAPS